MDLDNMQTFVVISKKLFEIDDEPLYFILEFIGQILASLRIQNALQALDFITLSFENADLSANAKQNSEIPVSSIQKHLQNSISVHILSSSLDNDRLKIAK